MTTKGDTDDESRAGDTRRHAMDTIMPGDP